MHVAVSAEQYGFDRLPALKRRSLFLCIFLRRRGGDTLAAALLSLCLCFSLQHAKSYLCDACFDGIDKSVQMLYNTNEHRSFFEGGELVFGLRYYDPGTAVFGGQYDRLGAGSLLQAL